MVLNFEKYTATGNDFVLIDDREERFPAGDEELIRRLCDRKFGIGADGLILLQRSEKTDFRMRYFNRDGREAEMCGNGARSVVLFARNLGLVGDTCRFESMKDLHEARWLGGFPAVKMNSPRNLRLGWPEWELETGKVAGFVEIGVPHLVIFVTDVDAVPVAALGRELAHAREFPRGTNVDFVQVLPENRLRMRTYERGVEEETLSCGTGATASAILASLLAGVASPVEVSVPGGALHVQFDPDLKDIWLSGPVERLFRGEWLAAR